MEFLECVSHCCPTLRSFTVYKLVMTVFLLGYMSIAVLLKFIVFFRPSDMRNPY